MCAVSRQEAEVELSTTYLFSLPSTCTDDKELSDVVSSRRTHATTYLILSNPSSQELSADSSGAHVSISR